MFHVEQPSPWMIRQACGIVVASRTDTSRLMPACTPSSRNPRPISSPLCQRSGAGCGGSLIRTTPPGLRTTDAAARAVTAGGPKLRAVTTSNRARPAVTDARSSASTVVRPPSARALTARRSRSALLARRSTRVTATSGRRHAMTRPGSPPPDPRSISVVASPGTNATKRSACATAVCNDRSPIAPRARTRSSAASRSVSSGSAGSANAGIDDHPSCRIVTFRTRGDSIELGERLVDDLAVRRRHRLQGTRGPRAAHLTGDL